jgi:hypothetical protein
MITLDNFDRSDIESSIYRLDEILSCGILSKENAGHILLRSAFIESLIALRDLMHKTEKYAERISFNDDVQTTTKINDVTDLIKYVRDALCHPDSDNHYVEKGNIKASYNVMFGAGCLLSLPNFEQSSPYADDVCFFFGTQRIFLLRHVLRAYEEAKQKLLPLLARS